MARKTPAEARDLPPDTPPERAGGSSRRSARVKVVYKEETETEPDSPPSESEVQSDDYREPNEDEQEPDEGLEVDDMESLSSEDLDSTPKRRKRKSNGGGSAQGSKRSKPTATTNGSAKTRTQSWEHDEEEDQEDDDIQLEEGQVIAGLYRTGLFTCPRKSLNLPSYRSYTASSYHRTRSSRSDIS